MKNQTHSRDHKETESKQCRGTQLLRRVREGTCAQDKMNRNVLCAVVVSSPPALMTPLAVRQRCSK